MIRHRRAAAAGAASLVLTLFSASCQDEVVRPDQGALPEEIAALPAGVHPIVSIPGLENAQPGSTLLLRIHLHSVQMEDEVASYQGVFTFDPEAIEIQGGSFPDGVLGAWNQVETGKVRFAGAVLEGIGSRPALELRIRLRRIPTERDFSVELEEMVAAERLAVIEQETPAAAQTILTSANMDLDFEAR